MQISIVQRTNEENVYAVAGPYDDVVSFRLADGFAFLKFADNIRELRVGGAIGFVRADDED